MTTTIEPVRNRFRTLDAACQQIEKLEGEIIALNSALTASRFAAPAKAQNSSALATAPSVVNPPAAAAITPAAKSLDDMSRAELVTAVDEAHLRGDTAAEDHFYKAYSKRTANR